VQLLNTLQTVLLTSPYKLVFVHSRNNDTNTRKGLRNLHVSAARIVGRAGRRWHGAKYNAFWKQQSTQPPEGGLNWVAHTWPREVRLHQGSKRMAQFCSKRRVSEHEPRNRIWTSFKRKIERL